MSWLHRIPEADQNVTGVNKMEPIEGLQIIREQALQQCRVIVAQELKNTSDPRPIYRILDKLNYLISENSKEIS